MKCSEQHVYAVLMHCPQQFQQQHQPRSLTFSRSCFERSDSGEVYNTNESQKKTEAICMKALNGLDNDL